jgi:hypothetical protein
MFIPYSNNYCCIYCNPDFKNLEILDITIHIPIDILYDSNKYNVAKPVDFYYNGNPGAIIPTMKLKKIIIRDCPNPLIIIKFLDPKPELKIIELFNCPKFEPELISWGLGKGISILINN